MQINLANTFKAVVFFVIGIFASYVLALGLDKIFEAIEDAGLYDFTNLKLLIWGGYIIFAIIASAIYPMLLLFDEEVSRDG